MDVSEDGQVRPLAGLIEQAREGRLSVNFGVGSGDSVRVNAEEFVGIDRACDSFLQLIRDLQGLAFDISERERWDLGEAHPDLLSGQTLVSRFRTKAVGAEDGNAVHEILEQHYRIVEDIRRVHQLIAQRYLDTDAEFASRYNELVATLPPPSPTQLGADPGAVNPTGGLAV